MPSPYSSPWYDSAPAFRQAGNTVQDVILGLAQQRLAIAQFEAQQQYHQQQLAQQASQFQQSNAIHQQQANTMQQHYRDQAPLLAAEALLNRNKANQVQTQLDSGGRLAFGQGALLEDPENKQLQAFVVEQLMNLAATHPQNVVEQSMQASQYADPAMRQILAAGSLGNLQHNIPGEGTSIGPTGQITATGSHKLGQGQLLYPATTGNAYNQPQAPIASGLPPRVSTTDPYQRDLATLNNTLKNILDPDTGKPFPGNEGIYGTTTNLQAQALGQILQRYQGTNAPVQGPVSTNSAPAVPPREQRVPGQIYNTPKGPLKWTGNPGAEWETVEAQQAPMKEPKVKQRGSYSAPMELDESLNFRSP